MSYRRHDPLPDKMRTKFTITMSWQVLAVIQQALDELDKQHPAGVRVDGYWSGEEAWSSLFYSGLTDEERETFYDLTYDPSGMVPKRVR